MAIRLGMRFDGFDPVGETIEVAAQAEPEDEVES